MATKRTAKRKRTRKSTATQCADCANPTGELHDPSCAYKGTVKPEQSVVSDAPEKKPRKSRVRKIVDRVKRALVKEYPYVLKDTYLQVTIEGEPFHLDNTHPTFEQLADALRKKNWSRVPKLVSTARALYNASHGNITIENGVVRYKGSKVDSSLTRRMLELVKTGGVDGVRHLMLFMDNLYQNPSKEAVSEFYDWLQRNNLPITDDGGFLAYKSVNRHNRDTHTNTIDNSPGRVILGSRKWFDPHYRTQCSSGYHICSKQYGTYGDKTMAVKAFPRDILSAVDGKMRVVNYEVLMELGSKSNDLFKLEGFTKLEKQVVVEVKKERQELIRMLLEAPEIKKNIAAEKVKEKTIRGYPYGRLKMMAEHYGVIEAELKESPEITLMPLEGLRRAAGLTSGQLAKQLGLSLKDEKLLEQSRDPSPQDHDRFVEAVSALTGTRALSFQKDEVAV